MSDPMPVMTRIISAESGSSRNVRSSRKSPDLIHVNTVWLISRLADGSAANPITCVTDTAKAASIDGARQAARDRLGQTAADAGVDQEAEEREERDQRKHGVTT